MSDLVCVPGVALHLVPSLSIVSAGTPPHVASCRKDWLDGLLTLDFYAARLRLFPSWIGRSVPERHIVSV
ncbi:hypothetical protein FCULG_00001943 [Fusarium culmorum]|uniref:Uncharacterized protein n=1 Tax=Fusarium culmorum TaxID=5516 RepID=A0A2T4GKP8_FUSCU|nr:hypothetical protein FCULG_00001943 [Fusarium culmorum]